MFVNITDKAQEELYTIYATFVSNEHKQPDLFIKMFHETIDRLKLMPRLGKMFSSSSFELRYIPIISFNKYYIFYYVTDRELEVVRVLYAGMDLTSVFSDS